MPIDRESGLDPATKKVLKFLQDHPNKAYRPKEIADRIGLDPSTIFDRVVKLTSKGLADSTDAHFHIK